MTKKIFGTAMAIIISATALQAQDSTKSVSFSGSVDAYYRYNFGGEMGGGNNYTSFTNSQSSFELGMASLRTDATAMSGKVTAVVDLGFGRRAEEFSYNDGPSSEGKNGFFTLANVKQAFITYSPSDKVKFTMGKFGTHVGYELLDAPLNKNYSMSYMFTNGPFFNTGLKADFSLGKVGLMLGVTNYTDESTKGSGTNVNSLIAQVSGGSEKVKAFLNYTGFFGSKTGMNPSEAESLSQIDLVVTGVVNDKFDIGFNGTYQTRKYDESYSWFGAAAYFNYAACQHGSLTLRSEYIGDKDGFITSAENIFANTLSYNYKVGPLTIIPEVRFESAQSEIYGNKDGEGSKSTFTALLAAVYSF